MTTNDIEFGSLAGDHPALGGSIDSFTTEEGLVIYDRQTPNAWLSSTVTVEITEGPYGNRGSDGGVTITTHGPSADTTERTHRLETSPCQTE